MLFFHLQYSDVEFTQYLITYHNAKKKKREETTLGLKKIKIFSYSKFNTYEENPHKWTPFVVLCSILATTF